MDDRVTSSTEIYKTESDSWSVGPDYHLPVYGVSVVQYTSDTILAVGGANVYGGPGSSEIYCLSKTNLVRWQSLGYTSEPRYAHVAVLIPKDFAPCQMDSDEDEDQEEETWLIEKTWLDS